MTGTSLNEELLQGNTCFGCGPANPEGLHIRIFRDGDSRNRLVGHFSPRPTASGFPHIVHGGLQFTALDCMAGWVMLVLRSPGRSMPLTVSATMRFQRAAKVGEALSLSAEVVREAAGPKEPLLIHTELRSSGGELYSQADFEYVLLPEASFKRVVGVDTLPDSYRRHFGDLV
jgi:acyl-coenzyme A thioesterase PaaI-like protein